MNQEEEQRILDVLGDDFPAVSEAINDPQRRYQHQTVPLLGVYLTPADVTSELFERFRETEWAIFCALDYESEPPTGRGPPTARWYTTVGFMRAVPVTPSETCYHVTSVDNEVSIRTNGIQIGAQCGKESRGRFADSRFYVNVSELNYVTLWTDMLYQGKPALTFPVHTRGLRFIQDPHCTLTGTEVNGYILVGTVIPPDRLGEPKRPRVQGKLGQ